MVIYFLFTILIAMATYAVVGDLGGTNCRLELLPVAGAKGAAIAAAGGRPPPRPRAIHKVLYIL